MRSFLVTGVNGFVGYHLVAALKEQGYTVIGTGRHPKTGTEAQYLDSYIGDCDLTKAEDVARLPLDKADAIINLAGIAKVGSSFGQEDVYMRVNVQAHTRIIERLKEMRKTDLRIVAVSTGAVYDGNQPMPLNEASKTVVVGSPYALSKVAMEQALQPYIEEGFDIVIARPFNHIGPGQLEGFLVPDITKQALGDTKIVVGSLKTERDYTDVRDVVQAYILLATQASLNHRLYNVCSGVSVSGETILKSVLDACGKSSTPVEVDKSLIRPNDFPKVVGDNSRIHKDTGWQPSIKLEQTIQDFIQDSRNK